MARTSARLSSNSSTSVLGKRRSAIDGEATTTTTTKKRRVLRGTAKAAAALPTAVFEDGEDQENIPPPSGDEVDELALPAPSRLASKTKPVVEPIAFFRRFAASKSKSKRASTEAQQLLTPETPRHRDALRLAASSRGENSPIAIGYSPHAPDQETPVTEITPPAQTANTTPRHRVQVAARLPLTPRTPRSPNAKPTLYNAARQLFVRSVASNQLVGREPECAEVQSFLDEAIAAKSGRCLYISGPPGTGKSAFVGQLCGSVSDRHNVRTVSINCMSIRNVREICSRLAQELDASQPIASQESLDGLRELFFPKRRNSAPLYVVTLDEIDHLLTFDLEILYTLFEWALNPSSRLVLIGIANALDLTDRFLPRLKARNLQPRLLQFTPYTVPDIVSVITTRLQSLTADPHFVPFVHPAAIQFCAKKVATQTGDLRKAFDLVRRVIDAVERETKVNRARQTVGNSPLAENPNLATPTGTPSRRMETGADLLNHLTPETAPRATVAHAARIASAVFNHGTSQRLKTLNVQQKAALCALVSLEKRNATLMQQQHSGARTPTKPAPPTVRALHVLYGQLCRREGTLAPLERAEFGEVVGSLEGLGLVRDAPVKNAKAKAVGILKEDRGILSEVSEKELDVALEGPVGGLLRGLLAGDDA